VATKCHRAVIQYEGECKEDEIKPKKKKRKRRNKGGKKNNKILEDIEADVSEREEDDELPSRDFETYVGRVDKGGKDTCKCNKMRKPVCATVGRSLIYKTFDNKCVAKCHRAVIQYEGKCNKPKRNKKMGKLERSELYEDLETDAFMEEDTGRKKGKAPTGRGKRTGRSERAESFGGTEEAVGVLDFAHISKLLFIVSLMILLSGTAGYLFGRYQRKNIAPVQEDGSNSYGTVLMTGLTAYP